MPIDAPWNIIQLQQVMVLNGVSTSITSSQVDFAINSLPEAHVTVPVGRDMVTLQPAAIQQMIDGGQVLPATILARVVFANGSDQAKQFGIPAGQFVLFNGYLAGCGYRRDGQNSSLVLYLRHWLSNLDYSSIFSQWSSPTNPARYSAAAVFPAAAAGSEPISDGLYDYGNNITADNVQKDIWASALQPFFLRLCALAGLKVAEQGLQSSNLPNTDAIFALAKMTAYPSLKLNANAVASVAQQMRDSLESILRDNTGLASHTIWDVLIGALAPEFGFAIVPRISDALIVPFIPTLQTPYKTITADEYVAADLQGAIPRPLRAVGLISGLEWGHGADGGRPATDAAVAQLGVGGWYQNPNMKQGMVLITGGPRWAEKLLGVVGANAPGAAGAGGKPVAAANAPKAAGAPNQAIKAGIAAGASAATTVLNSLAQARYAWELDRAKQGYVAGPFRLDIAPGTIVQVQPDGLQWLNAGQLTNFFGAVASVTISLDAQSMSGGTSFHLSHVRTSIENASAGRTVTSNPIYAKTFSGAGLLANPAPAK